MTSRYVFLFHLFYYKHNKHKVFLKLMVTLNTLLNLYERRCTVLSLWCLHCSLQTGWKSLHEMNSSIFLSPFFPLTSYILFTTCNTLAPERGFEVLWWWTPLPTYVQSMIQNFHLLCDMCLCKKVRKKG